MIRFAASLQACLFAPAACRTLALSTSAAAPQDHYEVLGVERSASAAHIKKAFRKRAKALHPDLKSSAGESDAEAFLRLVAAFEVLRDAEHRRLYDAATDTQLPRALRKAAAAQQAAAAAGGQQGNTEPDDADALNWRWGLADWARNGPAAGAPHAAADSGSGGLRLSVLSALQRHQRDLEVELHSALMTAFLGPRLELRPGELPPAFELDERSHPALTDDLLHLVHGRTLVGVVRLPTTHLLEGGDSSSTPQLGGPSTAGLPGSPSLHLPPPEHTEPPCQQQAAAGVVDQGPAASNGEPVAGCQQARTAAEERQAGTAAEQQGQEQQHRSPDAEIGDEEWRQLLETQHPLRGAYEWRSSPQPAAGSSAAGTPTTNQQQHQHQQAAAAESEAADDNACAAGAAAACEPDSLPDDGGTNNSSSSSASQDGAQQQQHSTAVGSGSAVAAGALGGRAAQQAWQQRCDELFGAQQAVAGGASPAASTQSFLELVQGVSTEPAEDLQQQAASAGWRSWQQQWHRLQPQQQVEVQQQWWQQWQVERQQQEEERQQRQEQWYRQQQLDSTHVRGPEQEEQQQEQQQQERQHEDRQQQQQQQRRPRPGHQRLWRWLKTPTPDWLAADWSFTDESEGVLVLRLLQDGGGVAAVAVRDDRQDNKPIKVWVDGLLFAALLDDIVLQPLTGKMMAVLYRVYTPGVHHCYFYVPNTHGASRVTARLLRRWMLPSSTWLWPARDASHDGCSWVLEWEGEDAKHRPGWMPPAVYVLSAAYVSYDLERRRLDRARAGLMRGWMDALSEQAAEVWSALRSVVRKLRG